MEPTGMTMEAIPNEPDLTCGTQTSPTLFLLIAAFSPCVGSKLPALSSPRMDLSTASAPVAARAAAFGATAEKPATDCVQASNAKVETSFMVCG